MRKFIILMATTFSFFSFAASLDVELQPKEPVAGVPFQMNFTIETTKRSDPFISFDPGKAEVQGRRKIGTSVQTTIINGAVETKRITRYAYDLIVNEPGRLILREIRAELDDEILEFGRIETNILREKKEPKKYFLRAEVSKKELYLGEGATVNYYLYFRVPVLGTEIREFPKLNSFIKRFHMPSEQIETIEEGGVLYRRKLIYSARVYPEQVGQLEIDPLEIRLQYSMEGKGSSPFSGFGFTSRKSQVRNAQSDELEVEVKPLPLEGMPKDFTGLVGKHEFKFNMTKQRYLVNEPIEVKLQVSGPGALENLSAPVILSSPSLENFDTESSFEELDKKTARKTFEYTYLARTSLDLTKQVKEMTYFDPNQMTYKSVEIEIPPVEVRGGPADHSKTKDTQSSVPSPTPRKRTQENVSIPERLIAPFWNQPRFSLAMFRPFWSLNIALIIVILTLLSSLVLKGIRERRAQGIFSEYLRELRKSGITYKGVFNLFDTYRLEVGEEGKKLEELVDNLDLSEQEKRYFKSLLLQVEKSSFKDGKEVLNLKFNKGYFDNLVRSFQKAINENYKEY